MSIELSETKEESKSSSFAMSVKIPDLSQKSTAIKIESNPMEKKKEENMEKKKPEGKFFYELLEEAVKKGLRPLIHQYRSEYEDRHEYDCPVALVCTLLSETFEDETFHQVKDSPCGCTISHTEMINMLRKHNVKFMDTKMDYCICCDEENEGDSDDDEDFSRPAGHSGERNFNEAMLAIHISKWHHKGNLKTVELLKESLYGKKPKYVKQLPKKEEEFEPMLTFGERPGILTAEPKFTVRALGNTIDISDRLNARIQSMDITFDPTTHIARTRYKAYVRNEKTGEIELRDFDSDR